MIFFKWVRYYADTVNKDTNMWSEHCAPNLLITFINMMLFKSEAADPKLDKTCQGAEVYMYPGQKYLQMVLVVVGVLMVPIMLFGVPCHARMGETERLGKSFQSRRTIFSRESPSSQLRANGGRAARQRPAGADDRGWRRQRGGGQGSRPAGAVVVRAQSAGTQVHSQTPHSNQCMYTHNMLT